MRILIIVFYLAIAARSFAEETRNMSLITKHYSQKFLESAGQLAEELQVDWPKEKLKLVFFENLSLDGAPHRCRSDSVELGRKVNDQIILWAAVDCLNLSLKNLKENPRVAVSNIDLGRTTYGFTRIDTRVAAIRARIEFIKDQLQSKPTGQKHIQLSGQTSQPLVNVDKIEIPEYLTTENVKKLLDLATTFDLECNFMMPKFSKTKAAEIQLLINQALAGFLPVKDVSTGARIRYSLILVENSVRWEMTR
jgi:hypothetical protein